MDQRALQSAREKLARGQTLTATEEKAVEQWKAKQEAEWRERIYRSIPRKDVKRLLGGRSTRFVESLAKSTGIPLAGESSDLFAVFAGLVEFVAQCETKTAPPEGGTTNVCHTMFTAAEALKVRIGRGSVRMLRDWLKQGMPGTAGGRGVAGHFPIEEMAEWARNNLDDLKVETDEASLLNLELKRQKVRQETLATEDKEQDREERRGNILPRDELTQAIHDLIALTRTRFLGVAPTIAAMIRDPMEQQRAKHEAEVAITKTLNGFADDLQRLLPNTVAPAA